MDVELTARSDDQGNFWEQRLSMPPRSYLNSISDLHLAKNILLELQDISTECSRALLVGNLPVGITDFDEVGNLFQDTGVLDVRIALDRATGRTNGYLRADFYTTDAAQAAKSALLQRSIAGRRLTVDYMDPMYRGGDPFYTVKKYLE